MFKPNLLPKIFLVCLIVLFSVPLQAFAYLGRDISPQGQNTATIKSATFTAAALSFLDEEISRNGETRRYKAEVIRELRDMFVPEGEVSLDAAIKNNLRYGFTVPVYINIHIDGKPHRQVVCHVKIHVYDNVVVAARSLRPHQLITDKDVRVEEREVSRISDRYFADSNSIIGKEINRVVMPGDIYTASMVKNPLLLKTGTQVTIISHQGNIEVRTEGITLSPGRIGAIIRVKNPTSRKVVSCRVIDEKTVEVVSSR